VTAVAPPSAPEDPAQWVVTRSISPGRRARNAIATAWMVGTVAVALVPVALIVGYVAVKGAKVMSWGFLSRNLPFAPEVAGGGIWPAIGGTMLLTVLATAIAVPLGVLGAIYLNEYGGRRPLAHSIRFMSDVMTGVPSIVMGLFIALIWVSAGLHQGYSTFAGSLALACLMLPIVIRSSEEMLKLVPDDLRQASDALGARRWRTVLRVVLPAALPGIVSGAMLAVARAAGETAPLLFTIGTSTKLNLRLLGATNTALPREIWTNAQEPFNAAQDRAWGAALALIAVVFLFTMIARVVSSRFSTLDT
jgi:phosphate transport system permease protein